MKTVFLTFLSLLFSSGGLSGFRLDQNEDEIKAYQIDEDPPNFLDLNTDVLYMILHRLELNGFLNVAEAFPELNDLTDEVFQRKYLRNQPMIKLFIEDRHEPENPVNFVENTIVIYDRQDCVKFFKRFGHFLQNVYIHYETAVSPNVKIINRALNKYCSKSLKQLEFYVARGVNDLAQLTTPFEKVEEFTIRITRDGLNASKPLNEIFPNLRRLNVDLKSYLDLSFIDQPFPHLNHLHLSVSYLFSGTNPKTPLFEQLKGVIMKNPTIQSLDIPVNYSPNFLTFLNEALPHLEHLRTSWLVFDDSETVQFDNVKSFSLNGVTDDVHNFEKISLPNLESLEMWCSLRVYNNLTQFLKRHTKLKQLKLTDSSFFNNIPAFNRLITDLPNLVDLTIHDYAYSGVEPIVQFIRSKELFQKFCFVFNVGSIATTFLGGSKITITGVTALLQHLQNEWTVEAVEELESDAKLESDVITGFSFKRKQLNQQ